MRVQTLLPDSGMTPDLPAASKLDSCRLKPGTERNQTSVVGTLALTGSSYGETEPKKQPSIEEPQCKARLHWSTTPPHILLGKSPGYPVVELATPNGTNNLTEGRIKTN